MRLKRILVFIIGIACTPNTIQAGVIVDSINLDRLPRASPTHGAVEIGWVYVPSATFTLTGVSTRFATVDGRSVVFELRDVPTSPNGATPSEVVGSILRTDSFIASTAPINLTTPQAEFAPIDLTVGKQYFFGFRGIHGLGQLVTDDPAAEHLGVPGFPERVFYSLTDSGTYSLTEDNSTGSAPILALYTASVPEPSGLTLLILTIGAFKFGAASMKRKQRRMPDA